MHRQPPSSAIGCAAFALIVCACAGTAPGAPGTPVTPNLRDLRAESSLPAAVPNDNRVPAGDTAGTRVDVVLVAQWAAWKPDLGVDSAVTVMTFSEGYGPPRIPGPLVRARSGTDVRITVRNALPDSALVIHGLRAGTVEADTVHVGAGAVREVRFTAGAPGTYLYWAAPEHVPLDGRSGRSSQLTGVIAIDPHDAQPDPDERIFVITMIDIVPDSAAGTKEDVWELAINGLSWPYTERQLVGVGDTVRWRWVNGSLASHPMHLHGFHFRVVSKGNGVRDRHLDAGEAAHVVTEFMPPGSTFALEWVPSRAGNWLMHCHMAPHITPYPERPDTLREHDTHDIQRHALDGMAGLVIGIAVRPQYGAAPEAASPPAPSRSIRLLVQENGNDPDRRFGYIVQHGAEPRRDSVAVPGLPLVLTRDETVSITVVNRTRELTTVHWHGIELESIYDGVAGWSGAESNLAPLIARGDSFTVVFTPPRAGTYIHHTHMDESRQLTSGMYAPLIVLEPGEHYDPTRDLLFIVGGVPAPDGFTEALNGQVEPPELVLDADTQYRMRFINILPAMAIESSLSSADSAAVEWTPLSKDGATLPASRQRPRRAHVPRIGVGETYDFAWTPRRGTYELLLAVPRIEKVLRQRIVVREKR